MTGPTPWGPPPGDPGGSEGPAPHPTPHRSYLIPVVLLLVVVMLGLGWAIDTVRARDAGTPGREATIPGAVTSSVARAAPQAVRVQGVACDLQISGSGVTIAPGLVVTNAHVVAGVRDGLHVDLGSGGASAPATVVAFDSVTDLAVLRTDLARSAATLAAAEDGSAVTVTGYPGGGSIATIPATVEHTITAMSADIYGGGPHEREVLVPHAVLEAGDSGGPVIGADGAVVGIAFALDPDTPGVAYAATDGEVTEVLRTVGAQPVSTGACLPAESFGGT